MKFKITQKDKPDYEVDIMNCTGIILPGGGIAWFAAAHHAETDTIATRSDEDQNGITLSAAVKRIQSLVGNA